MNNIKTTIETPGWMEILNILSEEVTMNTDVKNIKQDDTAEHIKLEVMSRAKAAEIVIKTLEKINRLGGAEAGIDKIIYR